MGKQINADELICLLEDELFDYAEDDFEKGYNRAIKRLIRKIKKYWLEEEDPWLRQLMRLKYIEKAPTIYETIADQPAALETD